MKRTVAQRTISREFHYNHLHSYTPRKTPLLKKTHKNVHLIFAHKHEDKSELFWNTKHFSEEPRVMSNSAHYFYNKEGLHVLSQQHQRHSEVQRRES